MPLSKFWDNEIVNDFNSSRVSSFSPFNNDCMCLFSKSFDGKVNRDVAVFAKQNGRKQGLLYNNRLYLSIINPLDCHRNQYEANRRYILDYIN